MSARVRAAGYAGLAMFEAFLVFYVGLSDAAFAFIALVVGVALAVAGWCAWRGSAVPSWIFWVAVAGTALRAFLQLPSAGGIRVPDVMRFLVPIGFALAVTARWRVWGVAVVGISRAFFVAFYATASALDLAAFNIVGVAGAGLLCWMEARVPRDESASGVPV